MKKHKRYFRLNRATIHDLNHLTDIKQYPYFLKSPTKNNKVGIMQNSETKEQFFGAKQNLKKDELILNNNGARTNKKLNFSIQLKKHHYAIMPRIPHHCSNANVHINSKNQIVVSHNIKMGDELYFNYLTTEYHLNTQTQCECGSKGCIQTFTGFKHLTADTQAKVRNLPHLSNYLKQQLNKEATKQANKEARKNKPCPLKRLFCFKKK